MTASRRKTIVLLPDRLVTGARPGQTAQGLILSALHGLGSFCEQRGDHHPADPGQGSEDGGVALLSILPRLGVLRPGQAVSQSVELVLGFGDLAIDQFEALGEELGYEPVAAAMVPAATVRRRLPQNRQDLTGVEAANAVPLQQTTYGVLARALGLVRGWHQGARARGTSWRRYRR